MAKKKIDTALVLFAVFIVVMIAAAVITAERAEAGNGANEVVSCIKRDTDINPQTACPPAQGTIRFTVNADGVKDGDKIWWSAKCSSRAKPFVGYHTIDPRYANMVDIDDTSGIKVGDVMYNDTCAVKAWVSQSGGGKNVIWLKLVVKTRTA